MDKTYNFYMKSNVDGYLGQWVAISNKKIISHSTDVKKVFKEAKAKYPTKRLMITKIPDKETMIF